MAIVFKQSFCNFLFVGDQPRTATINFGKDPNPEPDLRIFLSDSSPLRDGAKNDIWHISKGYGWIHTKLGGQVGSATRKNCFSFGEDPNPDLETRII